MGDVMGELVAAAASIGGGAISNQYNRSMATEAADLQRQFAQNAIQWRVEDAKKAGIHPLYALGANTVSYQPTVIGDALGEGVRQAGQHISQTFERPTSDLEKQKHQMDMAMAAASLGESDARRQYYLSMAAKERQQDQITGLGLHQEGAANTGVEGQTANPPGMGVYNLKAAEVVTTKKGRPDMSAGTNPAYEERYVDKSLPMIMPRAEGDSPEEILDGMSWPAYVGLMLRNAREYGPGWLEEFVNSRYFGKRAAGRYVRRHQEKETLGPEKPTPLQLLPGYAKGKARQGREWFRDQTKRWSESERR